MAFSPAGYRTFFTAKGVTIGQIRSTVVVTVALNPTSLLLPDHEASEVALMCWASDGARSYVQYWVTQDGRSKVLCGTMTLEQIQGGAVPSECA
jgi:hypothetical protein